MQLISKIFRISLLLVGLGIVSLAQAQQPLPPIPDPPSVDAKGYLLLEQSSGKILASKNADAPLEPASLTKLMTAYVMFNELSSGKVKLDDLVTVSEKAWRTQGSRMFIEVGKQVRVEDLMQGMIVQSGNDASVALAEHVAGSEATFAAMMNEYAQRLGMSNSHFMNATGLPAEGHITTATDIGTLARAIITEFPQYYGWYSQKSFRYNGITQNNRNALLWRLDWVDGLKTGMTDAAGYCLVSSGKQNDMRLVSVVMGSSSSKARADASQTLLGYGFRFFERDQLFEQDTPIANARVWKGEFEQVELGLATPLSVVIPAGRRDRLTAEMDLNTNIMAPVDTTQELGQVRIMMDGELVAQQPLYALREVPEGGFFSRMLDEIQLMFE
jgi:D-alanyl-D-alanine carboxypeptidase (penicillin-binding protein 5/6)